LCTEPDAQPPYWWHVLTDQIRILQRTPTLSSDASGHRSASGALVVTKTTGRQ